MREITKYIIRQLLIGLVIVSTSLLSIVWLSQSLRFIEMILSRGLSFGVFMRLTLLLVPSLMSIILPVALFAVTLFIYNRLIADRELVVMKAAGMSYWQLASPALVIGIAATVIGWFLSLHYVPQSLLRFREMQWSIRHDVSHLLFQEGEFANVSGGLTVYIRERSPDGVLTDIMVHDERKEGVSVTMMANKGMLIYGKGNPKISMINGSRQEVKEGTGQFSIMYFDSYNMDLGALGGSEDIRFRDARERSLGELLTTKKTPDLKEVDIRRFRIEGHKRISNPLYNLGFTLIAAACLLTGRFDRKGQTRQTFTAISIMVLLLAASLGVENIASHNLFWLPLIHIFSFSSILIGSYMLIVGERNLSKKIPPNPLSSSPREAL